MNQAKLCTIRLALGEREECPGPSCGLWDDDACVLEPVKAELLRSPAVACHLVDLRVALEAARASETPIRAHSLFSRLLNEEQAAEA